MNNLNHCSLPQKRKSFRTRPQRCFISSLWPLVSLARLNTTIWSRIKTWMCLFSSPSTTYWSPSTSGTQNLGSSQSVTPRDTHGSARLTPWMPMRPKNWLIRQRDGLNPSRKKIYHYQNVSPPKDEQTRERSDPWCPIYWPFFSWEPGYRSVGTGPLFAFRHGLTVLVQTTDTSSVERPHKLFVYLSLRPGQNVYSS